MGKLFKLIGLAAGGFLAGILMAPKSGKETRADLKVKAEEAKKKAMKKADELKDVADDSKRSLKKSADVASHEANCRANRSRSCRAWRRGKDPRQPHRSGCQEDG
jgi:gas vesicle protein